MGCHPVTVVIMHTHKYEIRINQTHYRPGVTQGVPGS